jgi:hypothetical protein
MRETFETGCRYSECSKWRRSPQVVLDNREREIREGVCECRG